MDFFSNAFLNFQLDLNDLSFRVQESFERNSIWVALVLNGAHIICKLSQLTEEGKELILGYQGFDLISRSIVLDELEGSSNPNWDFYLEHFLLFLSFTNAARVFFLQFTDYPLFGLEVESKFDNSVAHELDKRNRSVRLKMFQFSANDYKLVWVLRVWSPTNGSLNLLSFFSPLQVLLVYLATLNPILFPLAFFSALFIHTLVDFYVQSTSDHQLLSHELVTEAIKGKTIVFSKSHFQK
jgi:hypothetical protein